MKLNNSFQGTGGTTNATDAKSHDFKIGDASKIITILRKHLYSNPIQTLVQEYISNARDACKEARVEERIDVTVPTGKAPVFKVRDYGVGISPERIASVFVQFGASTKD